MSPLYIALLVTALILVVAAEWPRISRILPSGLPRERKPRRVKAVGNPEALDFSNSVQRDLDALPTISDDELRRKL